jgi:hypothetical protein
VVTRVADHDVVYDGGDDERLETGAAEGTALGRPRRAAREARLGTGTAQTAADSGGLLRRPARDGSAPTISFLIADGDPARYRRADEPVGPDEVIDYRYLYSLILDRYEREEDRGKSIDAKITASIAGVTAFIGFSTRVQPTVFNAAESLFYLIPLLLLLGAFMVERGARAECGIPAYVLSAVSRDDVA